MINSLCCRSQFLVAVLLFSSVAASQTPTVDDAIAELDAEADSHLSVFRAESGEPPPLAEAIAIMAGADQVYRQGFARLLLYQGASAERLRLAISERVKRTDRENLERLRALLPPSGWFRISEVGESTARQAWLLVQHSDQDTEFQRDVLARMRTLPVEEVEPRLIAYLQDRVAMHDGNPQTYGTQGGCVEGGGWEPVEIREPEGVDERRAAVGLKPLADYISGFDSICP